MKFLWVSMRKIKRDRVQNEGVKGNFGEDNFKKLEKKIEKQIDRVWEHTKDDQGANTQNSRNNFLNLGSNMPPW